MSGIDERKVMFSASLEEFNCFKEGLEDDCRAQYAEIVEVGDEKFLYFYMKTCDLELKVDE